jgi:hypothetical protein
VINAFNRLGVTSRKPLPASPCPPGPDPDEARRFANPLKVDISTDGLP